MGGNEAINYVLRRKSELRGVIATSPWLRLAFQPPAVQVTLGKIMNKIAPAFTQPSNLETAALSRDKKMVDAYVNDPLVHDKISARLFVETYNSGEWAITHAAEFPLPLLLMHGGADRITSAPTSREFAQKCSKKVTFHIWNDWYHETHNEPQQAEVFKMMVAWLDMHLK